MTRPQPVSLCVMFNVVLKLQTTSSSVGAVCVSFIVYRDRQTEAGIDKAAALDTPSVISPVASHLAGLTDN